MPVIPGCNDTEENILAVAALGKSLGAEKLSLLASAKAVDPKAAGLGRPTPFQGGKFLRMTACRSSRDRLRETGWRFLRSEVEFCATTSV